MRPRPRRARHFGWTPGFGHIGSRFVFIVARHEREGESWARVSWSEHRTREAAERRRRRDGRGTVLRWGGQEWHEPREPLAPRSAPARASAAERVS